MYFCGLSKRYFSGPCRDTTPQRPKTEVWPPATRPSDYKKCCKQLILNVYDHCMRKKAAFLSAPLSSIKQGSDVPITWRPLVCEALFIFSLAVQWSLYAMYITFAICHSSTYVLLPTACNASNCNLCNYSLSHLSCWFTRNVRPLGIALLDRDAILSLTVCCK